MKAAFLFVTSILLAGALTVHAADAPPSDVGIPYNTVNKTMIPLKSRKVDGIFCVPWYLRDVRKDIVLNPEKARFRIATWEGAEVPLKIEALASVPQDDLSEKEKKMIGEGYTHRMWIPKADKRFVDGSMLHSLPRGVVDMAQSWQLDLGKKPGNDG